MPRVIITTDPTSLPQDIAVLLDERVNSVHLSTEHAAAQLVERIAWAITDAEEAEGAVAPSAAPDRAASARGGRREGRREPSPRVRPTRVRRPALAAG